jgi:hypothetical protein
MSYPARGPNRRLGIDGKAIRANRRPDHAMDNRPSNGGGTMSYLARKPPLPSPLPQGERELCFRSRSGTLAEAAAR